VIINSQFYSTHFGVVVHKASSAPRLRFAYRGLCTFNSFGVNITTSTHHHNNFALCSLIIRIRSWNSDYQFTILFNSLRGCGSEGIFSPPVVLRLPGVMHI